MTRLALIAAALLFAPAVPGTAGDPAPPPFTPISPPSVLEQLNVVRAREGRPPLREDFRLTAAAEDRIEDMLELAYWDHQAPDGRSPFAWVRLRGYQYQRVGENLAAGFETAELLVQSWMESKGHRENILESEFIDVGIAVVPGSTTRRASGHSVVVIFGRERIAEPIRRQASKDSSR